MNDQGQHRAMTYEDVRTMRAYVVANRSETGAFDIVVEGQTPGADPDRAAEIVRAWTDAGATWWIEALWGDPAQTVDLAAVLQRLQQGPPRID
jgi:hypothetical protein